MEPAEAVLRFLAGVGRGSEAEFYLRRFREQPRESFAAIVVDPETMRENADGVALDLRLLSTLSLTPVVILGFYGTAGAESESRQLRKILAEMQVDNEGLSVNSPRELLVAATSRGAVPIVRMRGKDDDSRLSELATLLDNLRTHKLIFLRNEGGLRAGGQPLSVVNLSDEFAALVESPELSAAHKALLRCSRRLVLELVAHELLVTLTSPLSLLHELFTVKGAGTLLRRGGRIARHAGLAGVDCEQLRTLLTSSFGKPPHPDVFTREYLNVYIEDRYRGAALVAPTPLGAYLSKFAVPREAQGEGVGRDLWQAMTSDHRVLLWRARPNNPIRSWYEKQCDGRVRVDGWIVYWIGLAPERIPDAVAFARAQPVDF
jgi:acetylglutamate kinase